MEELLSGDFEELAEKPSRYIPWAELLKRTFGIDLTVCPHCGGHVRVIAAIIRKEAIQEILRDLNLPTGPPKGIYYRGRVGIAFVTNQVALQIREALFKKLSQLPISYYDQQPLGRTITRLNSDIERIESFFSNTLPRVLTACITVVSVLLAMLLTDFKIGFFIALSSLPAIIFTVVMRKPVRFWLCDYKKKSAAINAQLAELINGLPVIKVFGLEKWSQSVFQKSSEDMLYSAYFLMNWNTFIRPIAAFLCAMPIVVILW